MPNKTVKTKIVRPSNILSGWVELAEDAERDIAKAKERIKQLREAARIFRRNEETGIAFPSATQN